MTEPGEKIRVVERRRSEGAARRQLVGQLAVDVDDRRTSNDHPVASDHAGWSSQLDELGSRR